MGVAEGICEGLSVRGPLAVLLGVPAAVFGEGGGWSLLWGDAEAEAVGSCGFGLLVPEVWEGVVAGRVAWMPAGVVASGAGAVAVGVGWTGWSAGRALGTPGCRMGATGGAGG
ncbi:hypothetical protein ACGFS9_32690, partial [Streptomyces sp. NPDC048566]|uniref:hypothetical protein n=1 Tax=Streptomyces sp. NPDC048566 TaxID=3365569 RepID=UPI00371DC790